MMIVAGIDVGGKNVHIVIEKDVEIGPRSFRLYGVNCDWGMRFEELGKNINHIR